MSREIFQIEDGKLYLTLVNTAAVGYDTDWLAPGGDDVTEVTPSDYSTGVDMSCQVSSAALNASSTVNTVTVPATFCAPEENVPQPASTAYSLDATILQDPHISTGVSRFLFEHDTKSAYFMLELASGMAPRAIGVCRVIAGSFGGDARANLTATLALPVTGKPQILFGDATTSVPIPAVA
jgi:hypothetical protein